MIRRGRKAPGQPLYRHAVARDAGDPRQRLGDVKLKELTVGDVQEVLDALAGRLSTRSLQIVRLCL